MNATPVRIVGRYLLAWAIVAFFVVLLTFIFSFLGTIMCAVLAGMMLGAARLGRWHNLLASCIFPGALLGVLRPSRADLTEWQLLALMGLCFGAFWLTYFVASCLIFYEHKGQAPARPSAKRPSTRAPAPDRCAEELSLDVLQGRWSCEAGGVNGHRTCKMMAIENGDLLLSVADSKGNVRRRARAEIRLVNTERRQTLVLATPPNEEVDFLISI